MRTDRQSGTLAAFMLLSLGACSPSPAINASSPATALPPASPIEPGGASQGLAFAEAHCAGCHAVARNRLSPIPEAPSFEAVVNTPGLTPQTLATWLRDSHNYPDIMNFDIEPEHIADLSAYMMTLREDGRLSEKGLPATP